MTWEKIGSNIFGEHGGGVTMSRIVLSDDGKTLAIANPENDGNGWNSGSVRIYKLIDNEWKKIGQDIDGYLPRIFFGASLDLSSDGSILVAGGGSQTYVYQVDDNSWEQIGSPIAGGLSTGRNGSYAVSVSGDGQTIVTGDRNQSLVRIYRNSNGSINQVRTIKGNRIDQFGASVCLSSDGTTLAIGRPTYGYGDASTNNTQWGAVSIFKSISGDWVQIGEEVI